MKMAYSSAFAVQAVRAAIYTLMLCLPPYHHHLARSLQPFLLDLALGAVVPASVIVRLNVCTVLYKRSVTLNHLEITASKERSYLL